MTNNNGRRRSELSKRIVILSNLVDYHTSQIGEAEKVIGQHREFLELLKTDLKSLRTSACGNCRGYGEVSVWYSQSECKYETCKVCQGTGEKAGVIDNDKSKAQDEPEGARGYSRDMSD